MTAICNLNWNNDPSRNNHYFKELISFTELTPSFRKKEERKKCWLLQKWKLKQIVHFGWPISINLIYGGQFRNLSCVATVVFSVRLLHVIAFSKYLPWFEPTKVSTLKTQSHALNACVKRSSQRSFTIRFSPSLLS